VLRVWVSLPAVSRGFVRGVESASGPEKFELIRAGVGRKLRGGWRSDSTVAGNLAMLCRTSHSVWLHAARPAVGHYLTDAGVPPEDLPLLSADPLEYYDDCDHAPEVVLLYAMALGVDASVLEMIAADCANLLADIKVLDKATAQQERIDALEAEAVELRRTAKQADRERRATRKELLALTGEIERLRAAQAEAGSATEAQHTQIEQKLRRRAEAAEAGPRELVEQAEQRIFELLHNERAKRYMSLRDLDELTGGWQPGNLTSSHLARAWERAANPHAPARSTSSSEKTATARSATYSSPGNQNACTSYLSQGSSRRSPRAIHVSSISDETVVLAVSVRPASAEARSFARGGEVEGAGPPQSGSVVPASASTPPQSRTPTAP
jgi:hypothetical protein